MMYGKRKGHIWDAVVSTSWLETAHLGTQLKRRQIDAVVNNNDNNTEDNVYGVVIVAEPLQEFTHFTKFT